MDYFNQAADKVLSTSKYDILTERSVDLKEYLSELVSKLILKILEFLAQNLHWSGIPEYNTSFIANMFLFIALILVLVIIALIVRTIFRRKQSVKTMEEIISELRQKNITEKDLLWEAKELATAGNYRNAVRLQFIAMLWVLNIQNLISLQDWKTNGQFKSEIKSSAPEFYQPFNKIVEIFNSSWFGGKAISSQSYEEHNQIFEQYLIEVRNYAQKI